MAWLVGDGFDFYTAAADAVLPGTPWTGASVATNIGTTTRFGAGCSAVFTATVVWAMPASFFANSTTIWLNFAILPNGSLPGTTAQIGGIALYDASTLQCALCWRGDGTFVITSTGVGGTVLATSPVLLSSNVWTHVQAKIVINNTTGSVELRVDGHTSNDWNATSLNTRNGTANAFVNSLRMSCAATSPQQVLDDFYCFNDSGAAPNTWQGDVRAVQLMPTSDSSVTWTHSTGATNFGVVDEPRQNGDTDYVSTVTTGNVDLYGTGSLTGTPVSIVGMQTKMIARMDDAGPHTVKSRVSSSAATSDSSNLSTSSTYQWIWQNYATDPFTSAAWTASGINAALIGPVDVL